MAIVVGNDYCWASSVILLVCMLLAEDQGSGVSPDADASDVSAERLVLTGQDSELLLAYIINTARSSNLSASLSTAASSSSGPPARRSRLNQPKGPEPRHSCREQFKILRAH